MKIAITGASGYVGGRLALQLNQGDHTVCALLRASSDASKLQEQNIEVIRIDLHSSKSLERLFPKDIDALVHCAGGGWSKRQEDLFQSNTETTIRVLEAAQQSKVKHFILLSSIAAAGPGENLNEDKEAKPVSMYGKSKFAAEQSAITFSKFFQVSILRAPAIYGSGDTRFLPFFQSIRNGWCPCPPGKSMSLINIQDCIDSLILLLQNPSPSTALYYIEDGQPRSWWEFGQLIHFEFQKRGPIKKLKKLPIPASVLYWVGLMNELKSQITDRPSLITRDKWKDGKHSHWVCSSSRIQQHLGWKPKVPLEDGIRLTVDGYLAKKSLKSF